ncbi:MAG: prenyltransferase [Anaerolineae bacterium]|nr:prenyltransferase [Anaerolineae bacterium]MDK1080967.1 prenyltransferase [Anaerolineae bacterium]
MKNTFVLFRLSQPLVILFAILTYILGTGISRYLGVSQNWTVFWLGFVIIILAQFGMNLLVEALRPIDQPSNRNQNRAERVNLRKAALLLSISALATLAIFILIAAQRGVLTPVGILFLVLSVFVLLAYAVRPLRLVDSGLGELGLAVQIGLISPGIGFVFQQGEYHRVVAMISFSLTLLAFAYFITLGFPSYASDQKYDRRTFLRIIGWERAVPLHHSLVLGAYLILASAPYLGLAWGLIWPSLLTLPFAILQIFWLQSISQGAKPIWNLITINALAVFGLTTYFLTFAFWIR